MATKKPAPEPKRKPGRPRAKDNSEQPVRTGKGGRKPKLTPSQIVEAQRMMLTGQGLREVARFFKVGPSTLLRAGVTESVATIKTVAAELVTVEDKIAKLPLALQVQTRQLAQELRDISINLAGAAKYGSMTANRLSQMAHAETDKIDPSSTDEKEVQQNHKSLNTINALTGVANEAAKIGLNLLSANKTMLEKGGDDPDPDASAIPDDAMEASLAYRRIVRGDI